jgi:hypothetical protein
MSTGALGVPMPHSHCSKRPSVPQMPVASVPSPHVQGVCSFAVHFGGNMPPSGKVSPPLLLPPLLAPSGVVPQASDPSDASDATSATVSTRLRLGNENENEVAVAVAEGAGRRERRRIMKRTVARARIDVDQGFRLTYEFSVNFMLESGQFASH